VDEEEDVGPDVMLVGDVVIKALQNMRQQYNENMFYLINQHYKDNYYMDNRKISSYRC